MSEMTSVYMDACCFVEAIKVDASVQVLNERKNEVWFIKRLLQAHRDREITVFTSTLSIAECTHVGETPVPSDVQRGFEALLTSGQYVHLVQTTPFICIDARNLRWIDRMALRGADSIHLASAIDRGCSEFLSFDGRLDRSASYAEPFKAKGILIKKPSDTAALPGRYYQMDLRYDKDSENHPE